MTQRTYWHLEGRGRVPSDYEVVTSRLLYYPERGFEVASPVARHCAQQQARAVLCHADWEQLSDPGETTYSSYVERAQGREAFLDGLLELGERSGYDAKLSRDWLNALEAVLPPLRFPLHGLQMVTAYVGSMAPSGRIATATLFQAADQLRLVQRFAYRMRQLQLVRSDFGVSSKQAWLSDARWQPLRRAIEQLLINYDWTSALLLSSLVFEPLISELFLKQFAKMAAAAGDELLEKILTSLHEDQLWHETWAVAVFSTLFESPSNRDRAAEILALHAASVAAVVDQTVQLFDQVNPAKEIFDPGSARQAAQATLLRLRHGAGLVG